MAYTISKNPLDSGTGWRFGNVVVILTGVAALSGIVLTCVSIWLQAKNYRKPLLQRYVIRILFLVPLFASASWASLISTDIAFWIDPWKDVYEAFTIYAFFQLLINFIGGERALITLMVGRPPVAHIWPLNNCFAKIDISDPHTFLTIKRGILQYTWVKPLLAVATVIMKATGTYQGGYTSVTSGYFWSSIIYNVSISISLYALAMFWICMSDDLQPFRPMPKFLCIKGIIFASYWQGFCLSILVAIGAIPDDVQGYTPDNLAAAIQDTLICFEMPLFAVAHWYAFSWKDYADDTISSARMPVKYALRDACGIVDLIQDAKDTFHGHKYEYREFDAEGDVIAHEESRQRMRKMKEGMRYERNGKGKYWIPKPGQSDNKSPLLSEQRETQSRRGSSSHNNANNDRDYGTSTSDGMEGDFQLDKEDEDIYKNARALEFGDWNYPVITAHQATRQDRLYSSPHLLSNSTNRHILQPTGPNRTRRKMSIEQIRQDADKGKHRKSSSSSSSSSDNDDDDDNKKSKTTRVVDRVPILSSLMKSKSADSSKSDESSRSQLIDLVIEDESAEEVERVRARKEGSAEWNKHEARHFVRVYPPNKPAEVVREGFEPTAEHNQHADQLHTFPTTFPMSDEAKKKYEIDDPSQQWKSRDYADNETQPEEESSQDASSRPGVYYADIEEDSNVWNSPKQ